jgi:hypothetical protein
MTEALVLMIIFIGMVLCLRNLPNGLSQCLLFGFLQDPVRKMTPNQPVALTMLVGVFVAVTYFGAKMQGRLLPLRAIHEWDTSLKKPLALFIFIVLMQCVVAFANTYSFILPFIGLIAYLTPLPAGMLAYSYAANGHDISKFLRFYVVVATLMVSGIYLSWFGFEWELLKTVGEPLVVYMAKGTVALPSGFCRAPEIAAWHAGAACCFVIILVFSSPSRTFKIVAPFLVAYLIGAIFMTGRRKMLVEVVMFIPLFWLLISYFQRGGIKMAVAVVIISTMTITALSEVGVFKEMTASTIGSLLITRGNSVQGEAVDRLQNATVNSFEWVIERNGLLGSGAGTGSQGAQHFGGGNRIVGYAAEGGLGKILAELGLHGLLAFLFLLYGIGRYLWRVMTTLSSEGDQLQARLFSGMAAFVLTNLGVYTIAHQAYGDVFVLLIIGWLMGFILAAPSVSTPQVLLRTDDVPQIPAGEKLS